MAEPDQLDSVMDRFCSIEHDKPDFRELDLDSPVSPLLTRGNAAAMTTVSTTTTTTSSSSGSGSSGSISGRRKSNIEMQGKNPNPGHSRSKSLGHTFGGINSSVNSPARVNVPPTGNICPSGKVLTTGMARNRSTKTDTLGSGTGNYGHGNIIRNGGKCACLDTANGLSSASNFQRGLMGNAKVEELKKSGNEMYKKGNLEQALVFYDKAIALSPNHVACRNNRAVVLTGLGRIADAVKECEDVAELDPDYWRVHQRLGSLFIRLGNIRKAKKYINFLGKHMDSSELQKLHLIEKHMNTCFGARKSKDWRSLLRESDAAIASGADYSPQLFLCRAEALVKLHQLDDAESTFSHVPKVEPYESICCETVVFGLLFDAYRLVVQAQIDMACGRFENAVLAAEKAARVDPRNVEVASLLSNVRSVSRARARGNDLFRSERFTEACSAYGEGLKFELMNSVLYCNRAACWFKLGLWERSVDDCNQALKVHPNYTKAILRRATSNLKLERWADAVRDYEVLRRELPGDKDIAESLFHAQIALKKFRGEEVCNMKFGGEVEDIFGVDQFKNAVSMPGISIVHFKSSLESNCGPISRLLDTLCGQYPSLNFLKVDIEKSLDIAKMENVKIVPTIKIYKGGVRVKELVCPTRDMLEHSVRHYSFQNS